MVNASEEIQKTVSKWKDVTIHSHRFGGIEFRFGRRELGHLHGDSLLDIPFPLDVKKELITSGKVQKHHVLPESGWVSFPIHAQQDIEQAVVLLRRSYELALYASRRMTGNTQVTTQKEY